MTTFVAIGDNPAHPPRGLLLCALAEIADPGVKGFRFRNGDKLFAGFVVHKEGLVVGYVDSCPHAGWPLAMSDDRYLTKSGDQLLCSGHGALFRPHDGVCTSGPCAGQALTAWPVIVRNGDIFTS